MYIFISHSSLDKAFVRQLKNSLAYYAIPVFLDEQEIQIGDSIPEKVYGAISQATDVIYVISRNSVESKWVRDELSVAKMRQLSEHGCRILPVLLDDVQLPSAVAHIKYADFRMWDVKESYLSALSSILHALGIQAQYAGAEELRLLGRHLSVLMQITSHSMNVSQTYFQTERLWFSEFDRSRYHAAYWIRESAAKSWDVNGFRDSRAVVADVFSKAGLEKAKLGELHKLITLVHRDYTYWNRGSFERDEDEVSYIRLVRGDVNARKLAAMAQSLVLEYQSNIR